MKVAVHDGPPARLAAPWRALHAAQPTATPFTSPEWALAWWPHFATDAEPFILVATEDADVVGLAALVRRRRGPLRVLEPVGMEPGDYWDVLAAPGRREEVAIAFAGALKAAAKRWDAGILRCLPPDSPLEAALDAAGLTAFARPRIRAPAIELPETFDAYLATLSSNRRSNLRKHLRRLDSGEVELRVVPVDGFGPAFARWREFRRAQWEAMGKDIDPGHLAPRFTAFMQDATAALVPSGRAELWEFAVGGEVVGAYVNFMDADAYHWYLGGFNPAHGKLGIGKIAIGHGIRTSIAAGRRRYDFGRGAEEYKYWYGAVDRLLAARVVGNGSARSRAALLAARAAVARRGDG